MTFYFIIKKERKEANNKFLHVFLYYVKESYLIVGEGQGLCFYILNSI